MSYYLIDNPPVRRQYKERANGAPNLIVVHTSESPPDLVGDDSGAEKLAAYIQRRTSAGCYHTAVDSDSTVEMVPPGLQCFGARYVNDRALHVSHATKAAVWDTLPADYRSRMLSHSAAVVAQWCMDYNIPAVRVTGTEAVRDGTAVGICSHHIVDPDRRTDPGATFPWDAWLHEVTLMMHNPSEGPYGPLNAPIVAAEPSPAFGNYLLASDGGVFAENGAIFYGSAGHLDLLSPMTSIICHPDGKGYWLIAEDGGVFTFGSATYPAGHTAWMGEPHGPIVAGYLQGFINRGGDLSPTRLVLIEDNARSHRLEL